MAFEGLTEKLSAAFKKLRGKGRLSESDVKEAMREIRLALLEADVSYKVVKDFIKKTTERAVGADGHVFKISGADAHNKYLTQSLPPMFPPRPQWSRRFPHTSEPEAAPRPASPPVRRRCRCLSPPARREIR